MTTFTWIPEYGAAIDNTPAVMTVKFGDGYEQRVGDGIHNLSRKWSVTFKDTPTIIGQIDSFLTTANGISNFDWTPYYGSTGKWICKSWKPMLDTYGQWSLSATFEEVFEP